MEFDSTVNCLYIGVRELCRIACTAGDIDVRHNSEELISDNHKIIQSRAGEGAEIERALTLTVPFKGFSVCLRGRADIIHVAVIDGDCRLAEEVEEIKTVPGQMLASPPAPVHMAQAKLYAMMLCHEARLERVGCRLTYVSPDGTKTRTFARQYLSDELDFFLASILSKAEWRLCDERDRVLVRLASVKDTKFPYPELRPGQKELINSVYSTVKKERRLFAQAPTGIGKTISTLYGAVRALGDGCGKRIFYLTAKASTRREAYRAAAALYGSGLMFRTVVLSSREQCCSNPVAAVCGGGSMLCHPDACPYARGYYNRREAVLLSMLSKYRGFSRNAIISEAKQAGICPYELSLDLSELCDIIICDYNYVFDPAVRLRRYFSDDSASGGSVLLVDEAHNLPERARDMFSADFNTAYLSDFSQYLPALGEKIEKNAAELERSLTEIKAYCSDNLYKTDDGNEIGYYVGRELPPGIGDKIIALGDACEAYLRANTSMSPPETTSATVACSQISRICRRWRSTAEEYDERYRTYIDVSGGNILLRQYCLDPSAPIDATLQKIKAAVFFSATLTPADYFSELLGGGRNYTALSLHSPFPEKNLFIAATTCVSTRYDDRERSAKRIATIIAATASARAGNYIVYFPSYKFLDSVYLCFTRKHPGVKVIKQTPHMSPDEKNEFISFFREDTGILRIGFCVLGGSFSEGVDLPGDRLIGTVIAGVGLPGLSFERNLIRDYYENKIEDGYNYAYTYPGMNRVLQAAGRVIRRADDRGVVILADDRYALPPYTSLYPPHWKHIHRVDDIAVLPKLLCEFWRQNS